MAKVTEATELLCVIPNKPGSVAGITQTVSRTKTNIWAMMTWLSATDPDKSYCKMITSNTPKTVQAIKKLGYDVKKYTVLIVNLPNKPGAFYPLAQKIADAGININYQYATTGGTKGQMVLSTNNDTKAMRIIRQSR
jgi:hypothetical protein